MKKFKYIWVALLAVGALACSEDFLDKTPLDTINTSNFYQTETDAISAINGAYQPLQWPKLYNMRMWTSDIVAGNSVVGAGGADDGIETQDMANFVTTPDNAAALDLWRGPSPGILRCNLVLENVPGMAISETIKNRTLGEAHFLRGLYYFILVQYFGDVPLVTKPVGPEDNLRPFRDSKELIYNLIIDDLTAAIDLLPERSKYGLADKGRASKGSALGLLAKVQLTLGNDQAVIDLISQLETLDYVLNIDYADNFKTNSNYKNGVESLFEIQYVGGSGLDFWSDANQASWLSTFTGPRGSDMVAGGWGWNQPTQEFVDSYEAGDKRKDVTIFYEGCPKFDGKDYDKAYSLTGYNLRKFLVTKAEAPTYDQSPMNFPVLRYADILLIKAEALNNLGQTSAAEAPLNRVRERAGLAPVSGLSKADMKEKILHERRMELAFEGQRWFDLIRVDGGQWGLDFLHSIGKTNAAPRHLLFPIPQIERDANPNLTQNPGY